MKRRILFLPTAPVAILLAAVAIAAIAWNVKTPPALHADPQSISNQPSRSDRTSPPFPFNATDLRVRPEDILSGGPPKDGIPALTTAAVRPADARDPKIDGQHPPQFVSAKEADFLAPDDRIVGVEIDGVAHAYPVRILTWHEIVNDVVGETPIAVIYCPLCDSASVVDRRMDGETLEFGVSGLLHQSNILLYDRSDLALWSQVGLRAISGPHAGRPLKHLNHGWALTAWSAWKRRYPASRVMTPQTGHRRNYSKNPYARYFAHDRLAFPVDGVQAKLNNKEPVIGVRYKGKSKAYPLREIRKAGKIVEDTLAGRPIVIEADEHGAWIRQSPEGAQVLHTFWFTWSAFWPDTELYQASDNP